MIGTGGLPAIAPWDGESSGAQIAAELIPAIGRSEFPERVLGVLRKLGGCDYGSAFLWDAHGGPRLVFAAGTHPAISGFALSASRAYERTYWRVDTGIRRCMTRVRGGVALLRMTPAEIRDPDYRHHCYERGGICERLMLLDAASPIITVSGYRTVLRGPSTPQVVRSLQQAAPTLIAAVRRHSELLEHQSPSGCSLSRHELLERARAWGLSAREAEVVAGLATGQSQSEIARCAGIALNSVVTYRRRAYQKLRVSNRRELRALCERLISGTRSAWMDAMAPLRADGR